MHIFIFFFSCLGFTMAVLGFGWLLIQALEYCWEVRRTLRECRDALRRLEDKRKESL